MVQSRFMLLLLAGMLLFIVTVIRIISLKNTPSPEQPERVGKFKQLQLQPEDGQTSESCSIDYTVVHKKYPGLTFLPNYKLQSFIISDSHNDSERKLQDISESEAEERFYSLITTRQVMCANMQRMGNTGDGGWDICVSEPYKPKNDCLVYSFGINNDFSFDDDIAMEYGCDVRAFDPSMRVRDHKRSDLVWFYQLGLGAKDTINKKGWKLKTLSSILSETHNLKALDVLKIDIEYNEWSCFRTMINEGALDRVRQLVFEIHVNELNGKPSLCKIWLKYCSKLRKLVSDDFTIAITHWGNIGQYELAYSELVATTCVISISTSLKTMKISSQINHRHIFL